MFIHCSVLFAWWSHPCHQKVTIKDKLVYFLNPVCIMSVRNKCYMNLCRIRLPFALCWRSLRRYCCHAEIHSTRAKCERWMQHHCMSDSHWGDNLANESIFVDQSSLGAWWKPIVFIFFLSNIKFTKTNYLNLYLKILYYITMIITREARTHDYPRVIT